MFRTLDLEVPGADEIMGCVWSYHCREENWRNVDRFSSLWMSFCIL